MSIGIITKIEKGEITKRNRSLLSMEKRQTIKLVGYQKESANQKSDLDRTVGRSGATTEAGLFAARNQMKRSKRQAAGGEQSYLSF